MPPHHSAADRRSHHKLDKVQPDLAHPGVDLASECHHHECHQGGGAHLGEGVGAAHGAVRDVGARVRGALQVSQVTAQGAATLPEPVCGNTERRG